MDRGTGVRGKSFATFVARLSGECSRSAPIGSQVPICSLISCEKTKMKVQYFQPATYRLWKDTYEVIFNCRIEWA